jgi:NAD(P)-dependent dehydrogenase (short-subunit alcohol dehydrogenase family)
MTDRLAGKVAIITGASTGLGPVMAARFVKEGAKVLLSARHERGRRYRHGRPDHRGVRSR